MGKHDDSIYEIAEHLRKEALDAHVVHPRKYEHWEISIARDEDKWELRAKWTRGLPAGQNMISWLLELADLVSEGESKLPESIVGEPPTVLFKWKGKTDERERSDRKVEQAPRGSAGTEADPWGLVGKLPADREEDG